MVWDFAESHPLGSASGNWSGSVDWVVRVIEQLPTGRTGTACQLSAKTAGNSVHKPIVCTDPPYYDNIGYSDLSDFFYVWLRRSLSEVFSQFFGTVLTPKQQELVASPYRFNGDREKAERFFENGLRQCFDRMRAKQHPNYPITLFYAFKQEEKVGGAKGDGLVTALASTGWETMLEGLLGSGFSITATWPMRTERQARSVGLGTNALASSIVLVCRPRPSDAPLATKKEFVNALRREMPKALKDLQHGNIAPVDLTQASIGPGMAIFSRYSKVLEADGSSMRVRSALELINQVLEEILSQQEADYDQPTRWAVAFFQQFGTQEAKYGEAEVLARAKGVAVNGLVEDGIVVSKAGKVRLLWREELPPDWDPASDTRLRVWEVAQHIVRAMEKGGEGAAAAILRKVGDLGEQARDLAYRLYRICEEKAWAQEAFANNTLVVAWPEVRRLAGKEPDLSEQLSL